MNGIFFKPESYYASAVSKMNTGFNLALSLKSRTLICNIYLVTPILKAKRKRKHLVKVTATVLSLSLYFVSFITESPVLFSCRLTFSLLLLLLLIHLAVLTPFLHTRIGSSQYLNMNPLGFCKGSSALQSLLEFSKWCFRGYHNMSEFPNVPQSMLL